MTRRLLAGSWGPERALARKEPGEPRWFEPLHIRSPGAARERIAEQVASGADVVMAPTWRTHRRALVDVGETRRARAWTQAAAAVAREGVDLGLERRLGNAAGAGTGAETGPVAEHGATDAHGGEDVERPVPLVAGALPALDEERDPTSGRLWPRDAASERDYRDQAGLIADAQVDLIVVEVSRGAPMSRVAVDAAAATGLPVWVAETASEPRLSHSQVKAGARVREGRGRATEPEEAAARAEPLRRWAEECADAGCRTLLLRSDPSTMGATPDQLRAAIESVARAFGEGADLTWGGLVQAGPGLPRVAPPDAQARSWLEAGAAAVGLLDGATATLLGEVRLEIERLEREEQRQRQARWARWRAVVALAATMAPGGSALWLAERPPGDLPPGFDWAVTLGTDVRRLPRGRFRLVVDAPVEGVGEAAAADLDELFDLLDEHGILVGVPPRRAHPDPRLRLVQVDDAAEPVLAIYRREDA